MFKVKICGIRELSHLEVAVKNGASYVGFVFFKNSRRNVSNTIAQKLASQTPSDVVRVALMVDPSDDFVKQILDSVSIDMLQLHGQESVDRVFNIKSMTNLPVMKAIGVSDKNDLGIIKEYEKVADQILLDAKPPVSSNVPGGLGHQFDWGLLSGFEFEKPWLLAGGLNSKNVIKAIKATGAMEFDVSSGVEDEFGIKSKIKIVEFLNTVRGKSNAK